MMKKINIGIEDYDKRWPIWFEQLINAIGDKLRTLAVTIEHVGSIAVPGLSAKPILDIDVVIACRDDLSNVIHLLAELGYQHQGDLGVLSREAFKREGENVPKVNSGKTWPEHHLYVCPQSSPELARHLAFRDLLRNHPEKAMAYGNLKRQLALQCGSDRERYTNSKTAFIQDCLGRIRKDGQHLT